VDASVRGRGMFRVGPCQGAAWVWPRLCAGSSLLASCYGPRSLHPHSCSLSFSSSLFLSCSLLLSLSLLLFLSCSLSLTLSCCLCLALGVSCWCSRSVAVAAAHSYPLAVSRSSSHPALFHSISHAHADARSLVHMHKYTHTLSPFGADYRCASTSHYHGVHGVAWGCGAAIWRQSMPAAQQVRDLVDNMMRTALLDVDHKV